MQAALEKARDEADEARDRMQGALGQSQQEAQRAEHAIEQLRLTQAVAEQSRNDAAAAQQARLAAESKLEEMLQDNKEVGPPELKYTSWNLIWHMDFTCHFTGNSSHGTSSVHIPYSSVKCHVCVCVQLSAALQHLEQDRAAQTARLSAQLQEAHADAERALAAAAAAHADMYAELEERACRDLRKVELGSPCNTWPLLMMHTCIWHACVGHARAEALQDYRDLDLDLVISPRALRFISGSSLMLLQRISSAGQSADCASCICRRRRQRIASLARRCSSWRASGRMPRLSCTTQISGRRPWRRVSGNASSRKPERRSWSWHMLEPDAVSSWPAALCLVQGML